jgi:hypothetical protein
MAQLPPLRPIGCQRRRGESPRLPCLPTGFTFRASGESFYPGCVSLFVGGTFVGLRARAKEQGRGICAARTNQCHAEPKGQEVERQGNAYQKGTQRVQRQGSASASAWPRWRALLRSRRRQDKGRRSAHARCAARSPGGAWSGQRLGGCPSFLSCGGAFVPRPTKETCQQRKPRVRDGERRHFWWGGGGELDRRYGGAAAMRTRAPCIACARQGRKRAQRCAPGPLASRSSAQGARFPRKQGPPACAAWPRRWRAAGRLPRAALGGGAARRRAKGHRPSGARAAAGPLSIRIVGWSAKAPSGRCLPCPSVESYRVPPGRRGHILPKRPGAARGARRGPYGGPRLLPAAPAS